VQRILVVNTNRSSITYSWSLDYARQKSEEGNHVFFLDVSKLTGYYLLNKFRWSLDIFAHKNSFPVFAKSFCESNQIRYISFKNLKYKFRQIDSADIFELNDVLRSQFSLWYGSQSIEIDEIPKKMLQSEIRSYKGTRMLFLNIIDKFKIEKLVTINGRFTVEKAVFDLGKEMDLPVSFLESLSENPKKYAEFNISPHSIVESNDKIISQWKNEFKLDPEKTTAIAINHLEERTSPSWRWKNPGPMSLNLSDPYIAFFPTSDFEFSILDIEENLKPKLTQFEVVRALSKVAKELGLRVVVRGHPQPKEKHVGIVEDELWSAFCASNDIEFVSSFDSCDSLELAKYAHRNVVYYSSIAAEIAYLGYPVIATAPSIYKDSIPGITKETVHEIEAFIKEKPSKIPRDAVYPWAYYMKNGGNCNQTFDVAGLYEIYFNSKRIDEIKSSIAIFRKSISFISNKTGLLNFVKNRVESRLEHVKK
jgi:hypothetical protein